MRILSYILIIYVLAISLLPCSDKENTCDAVSSEMGHTQNHDHKTDHDDACSPFCNCSCCNTPVNLKVLNLKI